MFRFLQLNQITVARQKIECGHRHVGNDRIGYALIAEFAVIGKRERMQKADIPSVFAGGLHQIFQQFPYRTLTAELRSGTDTADGHGRDPASCKPRPDGVDGCVCHFHTVIPTNLISDALAMFIVLIDICIVNHEEYPFFDKSVFNSIP